MFFDKTNHSCFHRDFQEREERLQELHRGIEERDTTIKELKVQKIEESAALPHGDGANDAKIQEMLAFNKELALSLEKVKSEQEAMMKDWERQGEENRVLKSANEDLKRRMDELKSELAMAEGVTEDEAKKCRELDNKLKVEEQKAHDFELERDDLIKALQRHDYKGCSCQLTMLPAVDKAINKERRFRMGPRAEGVVDRLRREKKEAEEGEQRL